MAPTVWGPFSCRDNGPLTKNRVLIIIVATDIQRFVLRRKAVPNIESFSVRRDSAHFFIF